MNYYLLIKDRQAGPYALEQLRSMWTGGFVTLDTLYRTEGMPGWLRLSSLAAELQATGPAGAAVSRQPPAMAPRASIAKVALAVILVCALGGVIFFFRGRILPGGQGGSSASADAVFQRSLREFVVAGVLFDSMARQDPGGENFGNQLAATTAAFDLPSQSWPVNFAPEARREFEAADEGWKLLLQLRWLQRGETYHSTNDFRLIAALEAYAPGRIEYDTNPAQSGFIRFAPNIRNVMALASAHFAAGCDRLEKSRGK